MSDFKTVFDLLPTKSRYFHLDNVLNATDKRYITLRIAILCSMKECCEVIIEGYDTNAKICNKAGDESGCRRYTGLKHEYMDGLKGILENLEELRGN